jgi:hypothetical protein
MRRFETQRGLADQVATANIEHILQAALDEITIRSVIPNCRAAAGSEGWRWQQDALLTVFRDLLDVMRTVSAFVDPGWRCPAFDGPLLQDAQKLARRERGRCDQRTALDCRTYKIALRSR